MARFKGFNSKKNLGRETERSRSCDTTQEKMGQCLMRGDGRTGLAAAGSSGPLFLAPRGASREF